MEINIIAFSFLIAGVVVALVFCFAFFLELIFDKKNKNSESEVKEVSLAVEEELDLEEMLDKLEKKTQVEEKAEQKEKTEENVNTVDDKNDIDFDEMFARLEETLKKAGEPSQSETKPETKTETKIEIKNIINEVSFPERELHDEIVLESLAESSSPRISLLESEPKVAAASVEIAPKEDPKCLDIDYASRLTKLKESLEKLERDLLKSTKELNKFERTAKRKARNERLLDKKAGELTNLNLVMYNVNDIKDIDPEKKQKQEELVAHIAELKKSIKDAEIYLVSNKEKNANAKKLNNFLVKERSRYEEEITELEALIKSSKKK